MITDDHRASWDAETLMEAERIKGDENRFKAAQGAAEKMAEDREKDAQAMRKAAKIKNGSGTANKGGPTGGNPPKINPTVGAGLEQKEGFGSFRRII